FSISRVFARFTSYIGNPEKTILGTGFWFTYESKHYFCTNKHIVNPAMKLGVDKGYALQELSVELHASNGEIFLTSVTEKFPLSLARIKEHPTADVALVGWRYSEPKIGSCAFIPFPEECIATSAFFVESLHAMDIASFIGFPGSSGGEWWDVGNRMPIARIAH